MSSTLVNDSRVKLFPPPVAPPPHSFTDEHPTAPNDHTIINLIQQQRISEHPRPHDVTSEHPTAPNDHTIINLIQQQRISEHPRPHDVTSEHPTAPNGHTSKAILPTHGENPSCRTKLLDMYPYMHCPATFASA
ncbi:hypothetical protein [Corynebacterium auriscanis]|uniref:hypothetical protein n=1 Tax=Corynebacterium auriscanis TaxID=99807 RepID=UPI003CE7D8DE